MEARRVILATGARESPRSSRLLSGERPIGIVNTGALQSYIYLKHLLPFRRPVIVGTELVGLSALWTCVSHGIRPVAVMEEGRRPTARWPLGLFPRLLGVPIHYGARIVAIGGREIEGAVGLDRRVSVDGGVTASDYFMQFLADATGRTVVRRTNAELTAYGCARLAGLPAAPPETVSDVAFEPGEGSGIDAGVYDAALESSLGWCAVGRH